MSRILLAWELGTGYGHLGPFLALAPALLARGHALHIAAREIVPALQAVGDLPIAVHQAPLCLNTYGGLQEPPLNYAEILMRYGYLEPAMLRAMIVAWQSLFRSTAAGLVVADHAPTALLAARGLPVARAVIGGAFNVPPAVAPTPNMRSWVPVPPQRLADSDRRVLETINGVLPERARLGALHQVFDGAAHFLSGMPELDPYGARGEADYLGLLLQSTGSAEPAWPAGDGPRVFAYLNAGYRHLDRALQALAGCGARVLAYVYGGDPRLAQRYQGSRLAFTPEPVNLHSTVAGCDLCVCHGNLGTTLGMLSGGRPLLVLPMHLEHFLLGRSIERLGAGRVVHPDAAEPDLAGALAAMLADDVFGARAGALAARYAGAAVGTMQARAVSRMETLAAQAAAPQP